MKREKTGLYDKLGQAVVMIAKKMAVMEANTACPCLHYQPNEPKDVKELRKF